MTIDADAQDASPITLAAARAEFDAAVTYLDTATFGLPPRRSWAALQRALAQWRAGTADAVAYDLPLAAARSSYAYLAGVDPSVVPLISLDQRSTWYPDARARDGALTEWWLNAAAVPGWLLTSIFLLALASLARSL
jgi:hypothetical protein